MDNLNNRKIYYYPKLKNIALFLLTLVLSTSVAYSIPTENEKISNQVVNQLPNKKITINVNNRPISYILDIIKKELNIGYTFNGNIDDLGKKTIKLKDCDLNEALNQIFANTGYSYKIERGMISIIKIPTNQTTAQNNKQLVLISGIVTSPNKEPIIGATIIQNNRGAITDNDGAFRMYAYTGEDITVSCTGYIPYNVIIRENVKTLNIMLKLAVMDVDDVIVTGFQTIKKRESTAVIETLKAEDFVNGVNTSIDQMLQGKVAGMNVMQMTSTVGAAPKIRVRGTSTILGNREPLWVLDGIVLTDPVPLKAEDLNSMDYVNLIGNAISNINPEDIESINVLKDAAATALYGTKAANGVIEIITKRGKEGPFSINYSTSLNFIQAPRYQDLELMNSAQRVEVSQEMLARGVNYSTSGGWIADDVGFEGLLFRMYRGEINTAEYFEGIKKLKNMNTDWFGELFGNTFSHNHTISASGGNGKANYRISGGYSDNKGAPKQEGSTRLTFNAGLDFKISSKLLISANLSANSSETTRPRVDLYQYASTTSRAIPLYDEKGNRFVYKKDKSKLGPALEYNILNELDHTKDLRNNTGYSASVNLSYRPNKYFNFALSGSYNTSTAIQNRHYELGSYYIAEKNGINAGYNPELLPNYQTYYRDYALIPFGGELSYSSTLSESYSVRPQINFNTNWKKNSITISTGVDISSSSYKGSAETVYGYFPDRGMKFVEWDYDNIAKYRRGVYDIMNMEPTLTDNLDNIIGYFATAAYSYDSRYILSTNVRGDASNKLGESPEAQFKPAWTVSGRWNMTDEKFMQGKILDYISGVSFSGSFGYQANITDAHMPNMVMSLGTFSPKVNDFYSTIISLPNRGLLWEKTESYSLNTNFSLFKGKINMSYSYYKKISRDQLLNIDVSPTTGKDKVTINGGDISNEGWDLSLSLTPINTGNFGWNLSTNFSNNNNKISGAANRDYSYEDYLAGNIILNDYAVGSYFSYRYAGLNSDGEPTFYGLTETGKDGGYIGNNVTKMIESAMVFSGNREPKMSGGFGTSFRYKRLNLSMGFSYALGSDLRLNKLFDIVGAPLPHENMPYEMVNRWRKPGDENITNVPRINSKWIEIRDIAEPYEGNTSVTYNWNRVGRSTYQMWDNSDHRVVSGDFLRCTSLSLSYTFAQELIKKLYLKGASISFSVSNPFVIASKELKGKDPETVGLGSGTLPPQQSYSLSIRFTL